MHMLHLEIGDFRREALST